MGNVQISTAFDKIETDMQFTQGEKMEKKHISRFLDFYINGKEH